MSDEITDEIMDARYRATDFQTALLFAIASEIGRVHHNRYQTSWDRWDDDPHIPGIHWRRYRYDCDCTEAKDFLPQHVAACCEGAPHFAFEDVDFEWYKYPGRDMTVSREMHTSAWVAWFDRCLKVIRSFDAHVATGKGKGQENLFLGTIPR